MCSVTSLIESVASKTGKLHASLKILNTQVVYDSVDCAMNSKDDTVGANVFCAFCGRTFVKERNRMKHEENCSSKTQKLLEKEEEVTRCICGQHYAGLPNISDYTLKVVSGDATISRSLASKDAGQLFIQCDTCRVWQHGGCVGILDETMCPKDYYCERCRDDLHEKSVTSEGYVSF